MIQTLYFIGTVAAVLACSALAACCFCRCCAKVLRGADWTAKKYGSSYIVSVQSGAELVTALDDFAKAEKLTLGSVSGIGAVNEATLRFFNPETKKYVDKTFAEQMEIANLTGNISQKDGALYTHYHITLGGENYQALAGHLLSARINGAAEIVVSAIRCGKLERSFDEKTGLNLYDFSK